MSSFLQSRQFSAWLKALRDPIGKARILARIRSAEKGSFGDCQPVGDGISEMRVHSGPGYRVYFCRRDELVFLLLCGGDKATQARDIKRAKLIASELMR